MRIDAITTSLPDWYVLQTASQDGQTVVVNGHKVFPPPPPPGAQVPKAPSYQDTPIGGVSTHQAQAQAQAVAGAQTNVQPGDQAGAAHQITWHPTYTPGT